MVDNLSINEKNARDYINKHESQFSRESIKQALVNSGIKEFDVENYLNKYYNSKFRVSENSSKTSNGFSTPVLILIILAVIFLILIPIFLVGGALIFSFVDFGSLLPNKIDLNNNLRGDPTSSIAYSSDHVGEDSNKVKLLFNYGGTSRVSIGIDNYIENELGEKCNSVELINLDTEQEILSLDSKANFINGQNGLLTFDCSNLNGGSGLLVGDYIEGNILINVENPKISLVTPSKGILRLVVSD